MKKQLIPFIVIFSIAFFSSCSSCQHRPVKNSATIDSMTSVPDSIKYIESQEAMVIMDTLKDTRTYENKRDSGLSTGELARITLRYNYVNKRDSGLSTSHNVNSKKIIGSFVYYCPTRMLENSDNNVSVTITKADLVEAILQTEKRVASTTGKPVELIHKDVNGRSIEISTKMKVELKFSEKDFETVYKPENNDQIFDGYTDMNWDWIIKPTKVGITNLSIIVSAFDDKNGQWHAVQTPPKIFTIKVQVDPRNYFSKLWEFLEKNPEWFFIQILLPLITFFFGKRQGKR